MRHGAIAGGQAGRFRESARDRDALGGSFLIDARGHDRRLRRGDGAADGMDGRRGRGPRRSVAGPPASAPRASPTRATRRVDLTLRCRDGSLVEIEGGAASPASRARRRRRDGAPGDRARGGGEEPPRPPARDALTGLAGPGRPFFERPGVGDPRGGRGAAARWPSSSPTSITCAGSPTCTARRPPRTVLRKLAGRAARDRARPGPRRAARGGRLRRDPAGLGRGSARQIAGTHPLDRRAIEVQPRGPRGGRDRRHALDRAPPPTRPTPTTRRTSARARPRGARRGARARPESRWCYTRRPRVPLRTPVYLDGAAPAAPGYLP
jgi:hypothetical protein